MSYFGSYADIRKIDGEEFELVAQIGTSVDYDWSTSAVFRSPQGELFYYADGGCSCNSFGDDLRSRADMTKIDHWIEAVRRAGNRFDADKTARFASRLSEAQAAFSSRERV